MIHWSCICFVYNDKTWMETVLTCFTKMNAEQPSLTQYERSMYHMKENFWVKPEFPFTQLNRANTKNLEIFNLYMFYKNYCWAVICYPICVTNVSYERAILLYYHSMLLVLWSLFFSFFWDLKLNLGFLFLTHTVFLYFSFSDNWHKILYVCLSPLFLRKYLPSFYIELRASLKNWMMLLMYTFLCWT